VQLEPTETVLVTTIEPDEDELDEEGWHNPAAEALPTKFCASLGEKIPQYVPAMDDG